MKLLFWKKKVRKIETARERAERMERSLKRNPATGEVLITRRYVDAVIDEIISST